MPPSSPPSIPSSSQPTPKRKRDPPPTPPTSSPIPELNLNTNIPLLNDRTAGSPRTKVAYNFQGLRLEDGAPISKLDLLNGRNGTENIGGSEEEQVIRKRMRMLGTGQLDGVDETSLPLGIPETPARKNFRVVVGAERVVDPAVKETAEKVVLRNEVDPVIFRGSELGIGKPKSGLGKAYPSINRLADSKSRVASRKRMGTPPLTGGMEEEELADLERAALTWHDDEITGHNPDDPDDDGEGINGIGFKPTPAMAHARTEKRRLQMMEYRNREAREARAKRSERRRGSEILKTGSREDAENERRVRFMEGEVQSIISTG